MNSVKCGLCIMWRSELDLWTSCFISIIIIILHLKYLLYYTHFHNIKDTSHDILLLNWNWR